MNELFKAKSIQQAKGFRQIAGFLDLGAAVLQLIAVVLVPMFTFSAFGMKESYSLAAIAGEADEPAVWGLIFFMGILCVVQGVFGALTFTLAPAVAGLVNIIIVFVIHGIAMSELNSSYGSLFGSILKRGAGQYLLIIALLAEIAAIVLVVLEGKKSAGYQAPAYQAPAAPRANAYAAPAAQQPRYSAPANNYAAPAAPVNPAPAAPAAAPVRNRSNIVAPAGMGAAPMAADVDETVFVGAAQPQNESESGDETVFMAPAETRAALTRVSNNQVFAISSLRPAQVGRKSDVCSVALDNRLVSGIHARVFYKDGKFYLEDMQSTNGTFLNGQQLAPHVPVPLTNGAQVTFANEQMQFKLI